MPSLVGNERSPAASRSALVQREDAQKLLEDVQWDIEFHGFLTNHVKHAVIALAGLDAPPERVQAYWDEYTATTPYGMTLDPMDAKFETNLKESALTRADVASLLGKKQSFSKLCGYFKKQVSELGVDGAVSAHFATMLADGIVGALTHGVIHLGWALASGNESMVVEGLAYQAFCHVSLRPDRYVTEALPGATPLESMLWLAEEKRDELAAFAADVKTDAEGRWPADSFRPELVQAGFQWQVAKVIDAGNSCFHLRPTWLDDDNLLERLYELASVLHLASEGNFLVLHLITSLWGLDNVLSSLPPEQSKGDLLRHFWVMLLALLVTSGGGVPSGHTLHRVIDDAGLSSGSPKTDDPDDPAVQDHWRKLTDDAVHHQVEEHNIKLVYAEKDLWLRFGRKSLYRNAAAAFTDTPNISPSSSTFST